MEAGTCGAVSWQGKEGELRREGGGGMELLACLMAAKRPTSVSDQRVHRQPVKQTHTRTHTDTHRGMAVLTVLYKTSSLNKRKSPYEGNRGGTSGWCCKGSAVIMGS